MLLHVTVAVGVRHMALLLTLTIIFTINEYASDTNTDTNEFLNMPHRHPMSALAASPMAPLSTASGVS